MDLMVASIALARCERRHARCQGLRRLRPDRHQPMERVVTGRESSGQVRTTARP
jgi:hypothetical protein